MAGLEDCTWDAGVSFAMRWGSTKVPLVSFTPPKQEVKKEKVARLGEMLAQKHTTGRGEIGNATAEVLLTDYVEFILSRGAKHGMTLNEIVITATVGHPSVNGSYGALYDGCSFVVLEGPDFKPDEKALIKKIEFLVMNVFEKGPDGVWKALNQLRLPSSQAVPLLNF